MRFETRDAEARFALRAVSHAARLCRFLQSSAPPAVSKDDHSPVTVADFAAPAGDVHQWIDRAGEPAERTWALDPLDGTKGFLRGGQYAVALALLERGQVVLGALACPVLGLAACKSAATQGAGASAVRGAGGFASPMGSEAFVRLRVSSRREPEHARLLRSYEADHTDVAKLDRIAALLGAREPPGRVDSQAEWLPLPAGGGELIFRLISPRRPDYVERTW